MIIQGTVEVEEFVEEEGFIREIQEGVLKKCEVKIKERDVMEVKGRKRILRKG